MNFFNNIEVPRILSLLIRKGSTWACGTSTDAIEVIPDADKRRIAKSISSVFTSYRLDGLVSMKERK